MKNRWLVVVGYLVLGTLGLSLAIPPGYASPVFPAAGFALAVLIHYGNRALPAVWFGSLLLNLGVAFSNGGLSPTALLVALGIASGSALQAWAGSQLIKKHISDEGMRLEHFREIFRFLALGGMTACLISASIGITALFLAGIVEPSSFRYAWWNWYVGDLLGVTTISVLVLGFLRRDDTYWRMRMRTMALPVLCLLGLAAGLFLVTAHKEKTTRLSDFEEHGQHITESLQAKLKLFHLILGSFSRYLESSKPVSPEEFAHYTNLMLEAYPEISALSFNPLVRQADRPAFEQSMAKRLGNNGFRITERQEGVLVPAGDRPSHVVVAMINPILGNQVALGFDIQSEPNRRDTIQRAMSHNNFAASAPLWLVQGSREDLGMLVLSPVLSSIAHQAANTAPELAGYAVAVIRIEAFFEQAAAHLLPEGMILEISDTNPTVNGPSLLYRSSLAPQVSGPEALPWASELQLADRKFSLGLKQSVAYAETHRPWMAWAIGIVAMLFVSVFQLLLLVISGRASLIQRQVDRQTLELNQQNQALRDSEQRFRLMSESIQDYSIIFLDENGTIATWNKGVERIQGYQGKEIIGQPITLFYAPEDNAAGLPSQLLARARESGSVETQCWLVRKDHTRFYADVIISAIRSESGELLGYAKITRDVSERKRLEDDLHHHQENLELLVQQRTADLEVAKEAAEAASRAKTSFLSMASHELRTPMNGIMGTITLAKRRTGDPNLLDYLNKAERSAKNLLAIINDVLDISRIEADKLSLVDLPFSVGEVVGNVKNNLEDLAIEKGLTLRFEGTDDLRGYVFQGDPTRITQVLMNLVGNALKFTHKGGIEVQVLLRALSADQRVLHFEVRDTGIGIGHKDLDRIFNPFEQGDGSTTRKYGGTGLGLALCKRLVEAMDGTISVSSSEGNGSTFWFNIPAITAQQPGDQNEGNSERHYLDALIARHSGANILVVEDEPINQDITTSLLEEARLNVFAANDGEEAVEAAKSGTFDLILMDMNMPNVDGIEATYQIRCIPGREKTPIIALTANAFIEDREACIQAGMNDHLSKPFMPGTLYALILRWLDQPAEDHSGKTGMR